METYTTGMGLTSVFTGDSSIQQSSLWRPWTGNEGRSAPYKTLSKHGDFLDAKHPKTPQVIHPVKLYWPKSRCFDYLYQDADMLLRNYPVQATICPYEDPSSDEDSDEDDDEEEEEEVVEKEQN